MSSIDDRIVAMKFDNSRFERGVATTMRTLDRLKRALSFGRTKDPLADIQASANGMNLNPAMSAVSGLSGKFIALSTIAITALSNITNKVIDTGLQMGKSLTVQPIMDGFREYELKMGSIQTILSNTSRHGTTLKEVTDNLDALNEYADKTIYNFGDMTKNIGLFTNAGIKIEDATAMIKGFSNEAAASGTNAQGAASAAYQLSQALSAGTIRLMDWRSLQNVGMGNKNMQNGLIEIADAMGELEKAGVSAKTVQDDFNGSLEKKWLSAEVMENYLKIQAGEYSEAQMKNIGLTEKQIKAFQKQQKISEDAATKVRTWTQLFGTLQEGIGSGWAESFDIILGDFNEATDLFTAASDTLGGIFGKQAKNRNKILSEWDELGGRDAAIETIKNAWEGLLGVLEPIREAFRDIFPAKTGKDLYNATVWLRDLTEQFKMGDETSENLKRTFRGLFAIFSIGWQIIKGVFGVFGDLFGLFAKGSGGFLEFTGNIGDFFTNLDKDMKKGKGLTTFFDGVSELLTGVVSGFFEVTGAVGDFFDALELGDKIQKGFAKFLEWIGEAFSGLGQAIKDAVSSDSFDPIMDLLKVGGLAGIILMLRKFKDGLFNFNIGEGLFDSVTDAIDGLTDTFTAMQQNLQAKTLMKLAIAISMITASVFVLSNIDSDDLKKSLTALAVGFGQLLFAMGILVAISGHAGFIKIPLIAASMIMLSVAVLILSAAVKNLSDLDWDELGRGLAGVAGVLGAIAIAAWALSKNDGGLIRAGIGILAISIAVNILANAVETFAGMSWGEIGRGLTGVAGALAVLIAAVWLMPPHILSTAAAMLGLSIALAVIAEVVEKFGDMKTDEISQGLIGLAGSLAIIAIAMWAMPPNMLLTAASLLMVAVALESISDAVTSFGEMDWDELGRGLTGLAASLAILAIAMGFMSGTILGSAALLLAAAALAVMVPVLIALGTMSWEEIARGMTALAVALTILGVAAYLIGPLSLVIVALGAGMLLLGAGLAAAGAGAVMFATAFATVVGLGVGGINLLTAMAQSLIMLLPSIGTELAKAVVNFTVTLAKNAPAMVTALNKILISLLDAVIRTIPKIQEATNKLLQAMLQVIEDNVDDIARVGFKVVMAFLNEIRNNIYQMSSIGADIIIRFLQAISGKMPQIVSAGVDVLVSVLQGIQANAHRIVTAGVDVVIAFIVAMMSELPRIADAGAKLIIAAINAMADAINNNQRQLNQAANNLAVAIINGMIWGLKWNAGKVGTAALQVAKDALNGAKNWLGINSPSRRARDELGKPFSEGMAVGIDAMSGDVAKAGENVSKQAISSAKAVMSNLGDVVAADLPTDPVIRPVLDLTDVNQGANLLDGMLDKNAIVAGHAYIGAQNLARDFRTNTAAPENTPAPARVEQKFEFTQHNTSPESLSEIEIYRQTSNLLSAAKGIINDVD